MKIRGKIDPWPKSFIDFLFSFLPALKFKIQKIPIGMLKAKKFCTVASEIHSPVTLAIAIFRVLHRGHLSVCNFSNHHQAETLTIRRFNYFSTSLTFSFNYRRQQTFSPRKKSPRFQSPFYSFYVHFQFLPTFTFGTEKEEEEEEEEERSTEERRQQKL